MAVEAARGSAAIEESREIMVVLDREGRVVAASRRAREAVSELELGRTLPPSALDGRRPVEVRYDVLGKKETLLYLSEPAENAAYDELRAGFTAAVSHELRTPLARLLSLIESAARGEVTVTVDVPDDAEVPLRPRMLRVVLENLVSNSIRHAGPGARCRVSASQRDTEVVLMVADDGAGVADGDLPRLFERFYRADRARSSRGTGLGLAIVKHVVGAAAGTIEATGSAGGGLTVRCRFPR